MKYFDTHAHYNDEKYDGILEETLKKCKEANVKYIINVGYNKESSKKIFITRNISKGVDFF